MDTGTYPGSGFADWLFHYPVSAAVICRSLQFTCYADLEKAFFEWQPFIFYNCEGGTREGYLFLKDIVGKNGNANRSPSLGFNTINVVRRRLKPLISDRELLTLVETEWFNVLAELNVEKLPESEFYRQGLSIASELKLKAEAYKPTKEAQQKLATALSLLIQIKNKYDLTPDLALSIDRLSKVKSR